MSIAIVSYPSRMPYFVFFFFQAEDGIRDHCVTGVQTCALPISRPEIPEFYKPPMEIRVEQWQQAINSQATAFLFGAQLAAPLMGRGGRIIAITHSPGARSGSWQPWVGMGSAKAAMESLVRYFAVALARLFGAANLVDGGVLVGLPPEVQQ